MVVVVNRRNSTHGDFEAGLLCCSESQSVAAVRRPPAHGNLEGGVLRLILLCDHIET